MRKVILMLALAASAAAMQPRVVLAQQQTESVDIESNEMEIIDADKRAVFRGNVIAKRTSETIQTPEMVVDYIEVKQPDGTTKSEVDTMDCKGPVTITTDTQTITGDHAIFHMQKNELIVTGNAKVVQGKTVLRGPELVADLKTKRTVMKGGRVKGSFVPQ
ncbi:LptA/OstA family protein [Aestuariivirga sp.]|uniref:LptA/OstA family protein n=1 Tax=Aestuariivirga sp. TaxID=2650926 RepID=UPI0039E723A7